MWLILYLRVDKITESQTRLYVGLFVKGGDVVPQGADRYVEPWGDDLLLVVCLYQLAQYLQLRGRDINNRIILNHSIISV